MPGFFSSTISNNLTRLSGHLIDWSRVGELIASGKHRYSTSEIIQRSAIGAATGLAGYVGYWLSETEESGLTRGLYTMSGVFIGFVVSHALVIAPLVYKRYQIGQDCQHVKDTILQQLQGLKGEWPNDETITQLIITVSKAINIVMATNLADEQHARASQTLGRRRTLLTKISDKLTTDMARLKTTSNFNATVDKLHHEWQQNPINRDKLQPMTAPEPIVEDNVMRRQ